MNIPSFPDSSAEITGWLSTRPLIRVVNYHNTPKSKAEQFDRELAEYSKHFSSVNQEELRDYLHTGQWHKSKPGLLPVSYEGYRDSYDVLAPLLERHGFVGWYFVITNFINASLADQLTYAKGHRIGMLTREYPDGRYALSWDEIRKLDQKHVIASHARSHTELALLEPHELEREVVGSQEDFRQNLGHSVRGFASLRGPAHGEHPTTDRVVEAAGYEFVFSNYRIQRVGAAGQHAK